MMRVHVLWALAALCLIPAATAQGQSLSVDPEAIQKVLQAYSGATALEPPTLVETQEGFLRFLGAPPDGAFLVESGASKTAGPGGIAQKFVTDHAAAFGVLSSNVDLNPLSTTARHGGAYVRLQQKYGALEVFGAQIVVALTPENSVGAVMSDIMRDTRVLDSGELSTDPAVSVAQAQTAAKRAIAALFASVEESDLSVVGTSKLVLFQPSVVGLEGPTRLTYLITLSSSTGEVRQVVFVDASSGQMVFRYNLNEQALDREVYDAENNFQFPANPARAEDDGPTGIADVDNTFDYLGDTYNFFFDHHDRDSIDDEGLTLVALARFPFQNASYGAIQNGFVIGTGFAADDVIAHEYTHGVTDFTSQLIYFGFSGAINESFSDIWGEYVDLVNGKGDDAEAVRWFMGEDVTLEGDGSFGKSGENSRLIRPKQEEIPPNAIRYMKDPTLFGDPDRLDSPLLVDVTSSFDNGGVHFNSGIGNKLCYLLTDGDDFNGQHIVGMGIDRVAELFYETQFILTPASDYEDLYLALGAATAQLGFTFDERVNVSAAGRAVEIAPAQSLVQGLRGFRATPTEDDAGNPVIALTWTNPPGTLFSDVTLIRSVTGYVDDPAQGIVLLEGRDASFLDTEVQAGVQYYYTLIADRVDGFPETEYSRALGGGTAPIAATEAFSGTSGGRPTIDLSGAQLLFSPVGPPPGALGTGNDFGTYADYELTYTPGVFSLPEPREDDRGAAFLLTLTDDGGVNYLFGDRVFPYFGQRYSQIYLASNGYISFFPVPFNSVLNFPSLAAHFSIPRISYLFSDLAPNSGGTMWVRDLEDKLVITYEDVPEFRFVEFGVPTTNTVQVELFFSGHIRITYLQLGVVNVVVGLSDGNGPPVDPADIFAGVVSVDANADITTLPSQPGQLTFIPTPTPRAEAGQRAEFTVETDKPFALPGTPVLTAAWDGPGLPPFADNGNGTGTFSWQTTLTDEGVYTLRVQADLGGQHAYQDVRLLVGEVFPMPEALNLQLGTGTEGEDATQDRTVPVSVPLTAQYDYAHPLLDIDPEFYAEGPSFLYWFRNGLMIQSLINQYQVPPSLTLPGDRWQFRVVPITTSLIVGNEALSPTVSVLGLPEITSVTPGFGPTAGGTIVRLRGTRLGAPLSVKFGGVEVASIQTVSDQELVVVTPVHSAGTVPISVTTSYGTGTLRSAFIYTGDTSEIVKADLNGDGRVNSLDIQIVVNAILSRSGSKAVTLEADANQDGNINSSDVQVVVNRALQR